MIPADFLGGTGHYLDGVVGNTERVRCLFCDVQCVVFEEPGRLMDLWYSQAGFAGTSPVVLSGFTRIAPTDLPKPPGGC